MNKTTRDIIACIKLGIKLGDAVCYPFVKISKHPKLVAGTLNTVVNEEEAEFFYGITSDQYAKLPSTLDPKSGLLKFSDEITVVPTVFNIINKLLLLNTITNYLINIDDGNFLGIKTNKTFFAIVKWTIYGISLAIVAAILLGKRFDKLPAGLNKFVDIIQSYLPDVLKGIFFILAAVVLYKLASSDDKIDDKDKSWNKQDTQVLIDSIVSILELSDVSFVEKSLARNPKVYYALVAISTVAKIASAVSIIFTSNTPVWTRIFETIKKDKFESIKTDENTLFLYFCGTRETTAIHLDQFMVDVKAKHQIYINGIGSSQTVYKKSDNDELEVTKEKIGNNSGKYDFASDKRSITCIEKFYNGDALGYRKDDSEKVAKYAYEAFRDKLTKNPNINKIIIAGHSRGAAVGLPSFLYKLLEDPDKLIGRVKSCKIAVFPLDPVAGQTSNGYHMGDDWTTQKLYDKLQENFGSNFSAYEIWARSASMAPSVDFHPAEKFLYNPSSQSVMLSRLLLGYQHSGMVNAKKQYHYYYTALNRESPYKLLVNFINKYVDSLSAINISEFIKISKEYRDVFDKNDQAIINAGSMDYDNGVRTSYENKAGAKVVFDVFIKSYGNSK